MRMEDPGQFGQPDRSMNIEHFAHELVLQLHQHVYLVSRVPIHIETLCLESIETLAGDKSQPLRHCMDF